MLLFKLAFAEPSGPRVVMHHLKCEKPGPTNAQHGSDSYSHNDFSCVVCKNKVPPNVEIKMRLFYLENKDYISFTRRERESNELI